MIDDLTETGLIKRRRLYESPYIDLSPKGADAPFESSDVDRLLELVAGVRKRAGVA